MTRNQSLVYHPADTPLNSVPREAQAPIGVRHRIHAQQML